MIVIIAASGIIQVFFSIFLFVVSRRQLKMLKAYRGLRKEIRDTAKQILIARGYLQEEAELMLELEKI